MPAFNLPATPAPAAAIFVSKRVGCVRLDLFGMVSDGIGRDADRVASMRPPMIGAPAIHKTVSEAAEYMFGLLKAEMPAEQMRSLRADFRHSREVFAPYEITLPARPWLGEECFALAFEWAAGRSLCRHASDADDEFASAIWEAFCDRLFAAEVAA